MEPEKTNYWIEGRVDRTREHIVITYGDDHQRQKMSYIMPITNKIFLVQLLSPMRRKGNEEAASAVLKEINFYLVEKQEPNPWMYAQYHCGTAANEYSQVHWGLHKGITPKDSQTPTN